MTSALLLAIALWAGTSLVAGIAQAAENAINGRGGKFWAPVWWVALTWPIWCVVIALGLRWGPYHPRDRS